MTLLKVRHSKEPFRLSLGQRGEMIAWNYLAAQGYEILEKNYRCKIGEIDVVAKKGKRIAFIEIKTRKDTRFGYPEESVHIWKQKKLIQLAQWFLKEQKIKNVRVSFDVLSILWKSPEEPAIRLIEHAFTVEEPLR